MIYNYDLERDHDSKSYPLRRSIAHALMQLVVSNKFIASTRVRYPLHHDSSPLHSLESLFCGNNFSLGYESIKILPVFNIVNMVHIS